MTRFALHAALAALAAAPSAIAARADEPPPPLAQAQVRAAIGAQYAALKTALETGDAAPVALILAPDFAVTGPNGGALPASVLLARMAQFSALPELHVTLQPESMSPTEDGVIVRQHYLVAIPEADAKGGRHEADIDAASTDRWVDAGGRWVLKSMSFTRWTASYDGKAVQAPCFGCYPSEG